MPKIERHAPGSFCWIELATSDQAGAKSFYSALFGWTPDDQPIGPNEYYTIFQLNGGDAAGLHTLQPGALAPPHWGLYVEVENAGTSAQRAGELGGAILAQPFDVMTFGRMAVIQDPTGAAFCVWQSMDKSGMTVTGENSTFCWADLSTPDPEHAKPFYEGLFGWDIGPAPNYPPEYQIIRTAGHPVGGIPPAAYRNPTIPPHWSLFFRVSDVDATAAKARQMGGAEHMPPTSMGGARMAVLADPQGAAFSIIKPPA